MRGRVRGADGEGGAGGVGVGAVVVAGARLECGILSGRGDFTKRGWGNYGLALFVRLNHARRWNLHRGIHRQAHVLVSRPALSKIPLIIIDRNMKKIGQFSSAFTRISCQTRVWWHACSIPSIPPPILLILPLRLRLPPHLLLLLPSPRNRADLRRPRRLRPRRPRPTPRLRIQRASRIRIRSSPRLGTQTPRQPLGRRLRRLLRLQPPGEVGLARVFESVGRWGRRGERGFLGHRGA